VRISVSSLLIYIWDLVFGIWFFMIALIYFYNASYRKKGWVGRVRYFLIFWNCITGWKNIHIIINFGCFAKFLFVILLYLFDDIFSLSNIRNRVESSKQSCAFYRFLWKRRSSRLKKMVENKFCIKELMGNPYLFTNAVVFIVCIRKRRCKFEQNYRFAL